MGVLIGISYPCIFQSCGVVIVAVEKVHTCGSMTLHNLFVAIEIETQVLSTDKASISRIKKKEGNNNWLWNCRKRQANSDILIVLSPGQSSLLQCLSDSGAVEFSLCPPMDLFVQRKTQQISWHTLSSLNHPNLSMEEVTSTWKEMWQSISNSNNTEKNLF